MALWFKSEIGSFHSILGSIILRFWRLSIFQNPNIVFRRQFVNFFFVMWYSSEPVQVKPMISGNRVVFEDMKVGLGFSFPHRKTGKTEFCLKGQRSPLNPEFQENLSS